MNNREYSMMRKEIDATVRKLARHSFALSASLLVMSLAGANEAPATDASNVPEGPGRQLFIDTCAKCHAIGMVTAKRRDETEWQDVIARMAGLGAQMDAEQAVAIQRYVTSHFGLSAGGSSDIALTANDNNASTRRFPRPSGPDQWPTYGGGNAQQNYSSLTQITPRNVSRLKQAWVYRYGAGRSNNGDEGLDHRFEVTPLIIGGVMYISSPAAPRNPALKASITALVPETGEVLWKYESPVNIHGRGLAYWPGDAEHAPRLIFGTDKGYIMAVDVTTGSLVRSFGLEGRIDAYIGVSSEIVGDARRHSYTIPNPVTIYRNLIITGARPGEVGPPQPRGDIRAWDALTGRLVWTFHTVPQPGEPGHEEYVGQEWRELSGANVWSTMALDAENGIVFAPTGDLNGDPKGSHLYANSLLAIDASTGKLKWFRQITHRDIWDWDLPTPPVLLDIDKEGQKIPAVLLTGKQSLFFLFNRLTGEPLNGFEERPTPRGDGPSEEVWPTQPFPTAPGPLARTQMTRDEVPDLAPGMRESCTRQWDEMKIVSWPLYAPRMSSEHTVLSYPSSTGGPNWGGGSYHPELGLYFINLQNIPGIRAPVSAGSSMSSMNRAPRSEGPRRSRRNSSAPLFSFQLSDGTYVPCAATPWGELVAVDVNRHKIAWRAPLGTTPSLGRNGSRTGTRNLGGNIVTASGVIFIGAANDQRFRAFDARNGRLLWEAQLEAGAHSAPITYLGKDGKQYVVVAAAGGTSVGGPQMSDTLVSFTLP
jgi:glucose dehydrogenase